jgi:hypothetical protein
MSFGSQRIRIGDTILTEPWCSEHSPGGCNATVSPTLDHGLTTNSDQASNRS